ncbi:MAG: protein kinase [Candidatus Eisenbacteria bacterium]
MGAGRFEAKPERSRLKHPNIATIYSFEESQGQRFITMELVEGPTLDERLRAAPPSPAEALRLTLQIARGLEAAHARGVIHRDLKPLNIRVDRSGTAKLLDFGIAKSVADLGFDADQPTWIAPDAGRSSLPAGTPGFMSPEQAAGRAVDQRADIWAFGRILQACFPAPGSSRRIRDLIDSCLQEDLDARLGSMAEARGIIEQELHRRHPTPYRAGLVGIALVLAILLIVAFLKGRGEEAPASDPFRNTRRTQVTFSGVASWPEIAPAGDRLAYVSTPVPTRNQVLVQEIGSGHAEQVFESRSTPRMRWSPEGDRLLVAGNLDGEHRLYLVDASTRPNAAPADRILAVFPYAAPMAWSPDGRRFAAALSYGRRDSLVIATPSGDRVRTCAPPGGEALRGLDWSHDGKWLAVETQGEGQSRLWCGPADGTSWRPVVEQQGVSNPRWAHDDRAIYYLDNLDARLHAVPIDHRTGRGGSSRLVDAGPFNNGFGFSAHRHVGVRAGTGAIEHPPRRSDGGPDLRSTDHDGNLRPRSRTLLPRRPLRRVRAQLTRTLVGSPRARARDRTVASAAQRDRHHDPGLVAGRSRNPVREPRPGGTPTPPGQRRHRNDIGRPGP